MITVKAGEKAAKFFAELTAKRIAIHKEGEKTEIYKKLRSFLEKN